jgi:integrase
LACGGKALTQVRNFVSWLAPYFDRFVALKRASGLLYESSKNLLLAFDRYVHTHAPEDPFRRETLIQYVTSLERLSPLADPTARSTIATVCLQARIAHPQPRPHDFRHTFAVRRVAAWYQKGRDVNALLPALSTYLGHVSVENTRLYLTANSALLEQAAQRFAHQTRALDKVLS